MTHPEGHRDYVQTERPVNDNPLAADLDTFSPALLGLLSELRGQHLFLTGGTGLFGCWLLEIVTWANARLDSTPQSRY